MSPETVFRPGGVSYLRVPAPDPRALAAFYEEVFGWTVDVARDEPSFKDGSGHVIGHFVRTQPAAGEAGVRPYVYVDSVDETLDSALARGAEVVEQPYPEATCASPRSATPRATWSASGSRLASYR